MKDVFRALDSRSEELQKIKCTIGDKSLLVQMCEEAAELAQAAAKYYRAIDGTNPTPVSIIEAEEHFQQEIADVLLLIYMNGIDSGEVASTIYQKISRWKTRLNADA